MIPLVLALQGPGNLFAFSGNGRISVIGLAVLSTAIAYLIYFRVLASAGMALIAAGLIAIDGRLIARIR